MSKKFENHRRDPVSFAIEKPVFQEQSFEDLTQANLLALIGRLRNVNPEDLSELEMLSATAEVRALDIKELEELARTLGEIVPVGEDGTIHYLEYPTTAQWLDEPTRPNNCIIPVMLMAEMLRRMNIPYIFRVDNSNGYLYRHPYLLFEYHNEEGHPCVFKVDYKFEETGFRYICHVSDISGYLEKYADRGITIQDTTILHRLVDFLHIMYLVKQYATNIDTQNIDQLYSFFYELIDFCVVNEFDKILSEWARELPILANLLEVMNIQLQSLDGFEDEEDMEIISEKDRQFIQSTLGEEVDFGGMTLLTADELEEESRPELAMSDWDWGEYWDPDLKATRKVHIFPADPPDHNPESDAVGDYINDIINESIAAAKRRPSNTE